MAVNRGTRKKRFGRSGGIHSKNRKRIYQHKYKYNVLSGTKQHKKVIPSVQNKACRLIIVRRCILNQYKIRQKRTEGINRSLFVKPSPHYNIKRTSSEKPFQFKISRVTSESYDGYRLINLDLLQKHISHISMHAAQCQKLKTLKKFDSPIKLKTEVRTLGLASILESQCIACKEVFRFETSPQVANGPTNHYDVNLRAVWGSMVTGGGAAHLNETMATLNAPGLSQQTYANIEQEIGDLWNVAVHDDLLAAGAEERRIAIEKGNYHEDIPYITVICDGGWSKRTHKHTYNALGGVAVIIGAETGKLLHIGVRNKHCYICSQAESNHTQPRSHRCFQNWSESSQAMESDIIVEGFQQAEKLHGLRYMKVIADGDSSVYAKIVENVPVWGKHVQKFECANHMCKCLRSNLEKLVDSNPMYKGKNRLTKNVRVRLTSAVRCAIRVRSGEQDKSAAVKKLEHDIRNSIYHIMDIHDNCSDFCKANTCTSKSLLPSDSSQLADGDSIEDIPTVEPDESIPSVMDELSDIWTDCTSVSAQEESRGKSNFIRSDIDSVMLKDINILLDRVASKSNRLLGNSTTNLAESWMAIRLKFDGGKLYNRCNRGSWHSRCFGGCLRKNLGPLWSPLTWKKTTSTQPGYFFKILYERRECTLATSKKSKVKPEIKARRWKRKYQSNRQARTKKARIEYGPEAADVLPDISPSELETKKSAFLEKHINLSDKKLDAIENLTKEQSSSAVWLEERKKRITASNFASVVKRNPSLPVTKLVQTLLYSKFKGNVFTRRGLQEETMTIKEYVTSKAQQNEHIRVQQCGLIVCKKNKFLAASPDGKIVGENGDVVGLLEIKNLLHSKPIDLNEAVAQVKSFCLEHHGTSNELRLKRNHPYFYQVQGQLNISNLPWADFVVRTTNPYQLHIERIYINNDLWNITMVPKLKDFYYKALLPELASPRYGTIDGIREPGAWHKKDKVHITFETEEASTSGVPKKTTTTKRNTPTSIRGSSGTACVGQLNDSSSASLVKRSKRTPRIKFVGRRISHEWVDNDSSQKKTWYEGTVIRTLLGKDGDPTAVYEVLYDGEDEPCEVDQLLEDYQTSSLKFLDL